MTYHHLHQNYVRDAIAAIDTALQRLEQRFSNFI